VGTHLVVRAQLTIMCRSPLSGHNKEIPRPDTEIPVPLLRTLSGTVHRQQIDKWPQRKKWKQHAWKQSLDVGSKRRAAAAGKS